MSETIPFDEEDRLTTPDEVPDRDVVEYDPCVGTDLLRAEFRLYVEEVVFKLVGADVPHIKITVFLSFSTLGCMWITLDYIKSNLISYRLDRK